mmetsp:Transcript_28413/g.32508  ORF Transcript_28413/g.32508 Transcript_28413/m.32508 type:complete len:157 (+) Transcript_28413:376-846(+)
MRRSEVMQLINEMKDKLVEQEDRICQLLKSNKEFKNNVLVLYSELEKSKEREKKVENILIELVPHSQTKRESCGKLQNKDFFEQLKEKSASEKTFRLEASEIISMFRNFLENIYIQQFGRNDVNNANFIFDYSPFEAQAQGPRPKYQYDMPKSSNQ